jgi:predicted ATP-binding protein involved in virulence
MNYLAGIRLKNYCGYRDTNLRFINLDGGEIKRVNVIFGPNGEGKSTLLEAISLVSNPFIYSGRDCSLMFRKKTYHPDYDPTYAEFKEIKGGMEIEGVFSTSDGFKTIEINNKGLVRSNLEHKNRGYSYKIDADNPLNTVRFQIAAEMSDVFLEIAKVVYGFECEFTMGVEEKLENFDGSKTQVEIYTDFIIHKEKKVHFKNMSAGEKKIATLLSYLCDKMYMDSIDIILIDNIDSHVYFKRHAAMIDKIIEFFPNKQFIVTTHSGTLIQHVLDNYGRDCLFDLEEIKE